jgi:hypothetical protein
VAQAAEIKEYLTVLDLIVDCSIGETMKTEEGIVYRNAGGIFATAPGFFSSNGYDRSTKYHEG